MSFRQANPLDAVAAASGVGAAVAVPVVWGAVRGEVRRGWGVVGDVVAVAHGVPGVGGLVPGFLGVVGFVVVEAGFADADAVVSHCWASAFL